jgi:hypothetical protein
MSLPSPPPKWDLQDISRFFDAARANQFATFANLKGDVSRLSDIDSAYRKAIDCVNHSKEWFAGFFVLRAHSNFLASCCLGWSGQIPEAYSVLRSCLENTLYGLYLSRNPNSRETWLRRQDDAASKKKVKKEFKIGTFLDLAEAVDPKEGAVARQLYERTIDYGAHPNELALMQTLQINEGASNVEFKSNYLDGGTVALRLALKTTAQVGVCSLSIFRTIYPERFDILGLTDSLRQIKVGL